MIYKMVGDPMSIRPLDECTITTLRLVRLVGRNHWCSCQHLNSCSSSSSSSRFHNSQCRKNSEIRSISGTATAESRGTHSRRRTSEREQQHRDKKKHHNNNGKKKEEIMEGCVLLTHTQPLTKHKGGKREKEKGTDGRSHPPAFECRPSKP